MPTCERILFAKILSYNTCKNQQLIQSQPLHESFPVSKNLKLRRSSENVILKVESGDFVVWLKST